MSEYLKRVAEIEKDPQQRLALYSSGNQVVIAGPGSGKTYLLTTKVAQTLLDGPARFPHKAVCITFSRQLAANIEKELRALGVYDSDRVYVGTVHAFCIKEIIMPIAGLLLQQRVPTPFRIASKQEICNALSRALEDQGVSLPREERCRRNIQSNLDKFRRLHFFPDDGTTFSSGFPESDGYSRQALTDLDWSRLARDYTHHLLAGDPGAVDFVCVELLALRVILDHPSVAMTLSAAYPWWFVDEYQDLSPLFHRLVTHLVESRQVTVFAIGDPNQCIYEELHGSRPLFLKELAETAYQVSGNATVTLRTNYRSAQNIINLGDVVLGKETGYRSSRQEPGICHAVECRPDQIRTLIRRLLLKLTDGSVSSNAMRVAILAPQRATLETILRDLENDNRRSVVIDKDPDYDAYLDLVAWVRDLAKWCSGGEVEFHQLVPFWYQLNQLAYGIHDRQHQAELDEQLFDVLWSLRQGNLLLSDWLKSVVASLDFATLLKPYEVLRPDDVTELRALYSATGTSSRLRRQSVREFALLDNSVFLTTLHSSKGLEFDAAVIVELDTIRSSPVVPELRSRLAYVAVTRAKTDLYLLVCQPSSPFAAEFARQPADILRYWCCRADGKLMPK